MEIVHIWVKRYRNLENLSFNFSNRYLYKFDPSTRKIERTAITEIHLDNFFGPSIINLTAVVGENAVGKTSIFNIIQIIYGDLYEFYINPAKKKQYSNIEYLAIFRKDNKEYYYSNNTKTKIATTITALSKKQKTFFDKLFIAYYGNTFDYSSNNHSNYTIDLSTTGLVNMVMKEIIVTAQRDEETIYGADFEFIYKTKEVLSQLEFLANFRNQISFEIPNQLRVRVNLKYPDNLLMAEPDNDDDDEMDLERNKEKPDEEDIIYFSSRNIMRTLYHKYNISPKPKNKHNEILLVFKRRVQRAAILNYLDNVVFKDDSVVADLSHANFDLARIISESKITRAKDLDKLFVQIFDLIRPHASHGYDGLTLLAWINRLVALGADIEGVDIEQEIIELDFTKIASTQFELLMKEYSVFSYYPAFIDFYWEGISSGENALLTMFSRFFEFRKLWSKSNTTLIFLLDECEVNFHPAWQRNLILYLTDIFPKMFPSCKFQFFVSSHSPIILSDIPRSNVLFLQKKDGKVGITHLSDKKQTFAANIHTLLSDTFFLQEGTIGEHAKRKINWVIDQLNSRYAVFEKNLKEVQDITDLIGEPVIKSKLTSMINDKHSLSLYNIDKRVKKLEGKKKKK